MDFEDSPQEAQYRAGVRAWLAQQAPAWCAPEGEEGEDAFVARATGWQACKSAGGYIGITWPREVGGQGGEPIKQLLFAQEEGRYDLALVPYQVGMGMCIPTLCSCADAATVQRHVGPAMRGETIWCQMFSEPAAGSDLAGIRTRAIAEDGGWRINGQKVWTSWAHYSDWGLLLARTDPAVPKHKGLSMFYLDMRAPGVEIRPIRGMVGRSDFNEVFLTDVWIPDAQRIGGVGQGWKVALTTLMHERLAIGRPPDAPGVAELIRLARKAGDSKLESGALREAIARFYINDAGLEFTRLRMQTALSKGLTPGPEAAIGKLVMAKTRQDIGACAMDLLESGAIRAASDGALERFQFHYMYAPGFRIAGGTDEILRNIIAERVLGLPSDLRIDRDVPFNSIK